MKYKKHTLKISRVAHLITLAVFILSFTISHNLNTSIASAAFLSKADIEFVLHDPASDEDTQYETATSFRFPLDGSWSVALDFGDITTLGTHLGEDVSRPAETKVYASANGIVRFAGYASGYGTAAIIEHYTGNEYVCTLYGHLSSRMGLKVSSGQEISKGDLLGYVAYQDENEDTQEWSPHIHFGVYKGVHKLSWHYYGYSPPANVADLYDPSDFINRHQEPQDRSLVNPSDSPYQDRIYWLQNDKLYWITESVDNNSNLGTVIGEMSSLPGWNEESIVQSSSAELESYSGWPDSIATFITTSIESNGLLIRKNGDVDINIIDNGNKIFIPDKAALDHAGYSKADVIDVTNVIYDLFPDAIDDARIVEKSNDIVVNPGQTFNVWVAIKNTGTSVWSEKLQYRLGWLSGYESFPSSEPLTRITLGSSDNITPVSAKHWNINGITAPQKPGVYTMVWQMTRETLFQYKMSLEGRLISNTK